MNKFEKTVIVISKALDKISAAGVFAMMLLVVYNVISRALFSRPLLGTIEYVGFLFTIIIGLSLANCALRGGHISLGILVEKFPSRLRNVFEAITNTISMVLMFYTSWYLLEYAFRMIRNGQVSSTAQTPIYPFIIIVAFGFLVMGLVMILRIINTVKKGIDR
jgi:TRAP-type C4-dicarboxylate transport system permease small subunit